MKLSKPPALATWLLEHMIPGGKNEALAGDLMEQFGEGRTSAWYWRQVAVAILAGLAREARILWIAMGLTVVWTFALNQLYGRFWFSAQNLVVGIFLNEHSNQGYLLDVSLCLTAFNALPITLAVVAYLAMTRSFGVRRFVRGLFAGLLAMGFGFFVIFTFVRNLEHARAFPWHVFAPLPIFFALLVCMWVARPIHDGRSAVAGISA